MFIMDRMAPLQIKNYLEKQAAESGESVKDLIKTWKDYLNMAIRVGVNVQDSVIYRARKLMQRHNDYSKRENGLIMISYDNLKKLQEIGMDIDELVSGKRDDKMNDVGKQEHKEKKAAVILAAGSGRRMNTPVASGWI